ncbi:MAG: hypothetical protein V2A54_12310 [Bacteroidota bacterium]
MNISLSTDFHPAFILLCLLLGAVYAFLLYRRDSHLESTSRWLRRILFSLRFIAVSVIAFLLLNPLLDLISRDVEKPVLVIAQDNSSSILLNRDSAFYKNEYAVKLQKLADELSSKYEVRLLSFGSDVRDSLQFRYNDKLTDIAELFTDLKNRYENRNLGGIILATDGIYNRGPDPAWAADKLKVPLYTIAMGDTNVRRDIAVPSVAYNQFVFPGNKFTIEPFITAKKCKGEVAKISVTKGNQVVYSQNIPITSDDFTANIPVTLQADQPGTIHLHIAIASLPGEVTTANNHADIFIEVIDDRQKILILYSSPHPDIAAIQQTIARNPAFTADLMEAKQFSGDINAYNLVILHQVPGVNASDNNVINTLRKSNVPALFILGSKSDISRFNLMNAGMSLDYNKKTKWNEALSTYDERFSLFTLSDYAIRSLEKFPPLISFYGTYRTSPNATVFLYQKIGSVTTRDPLILFSTQGDRRSGVIAGEGIWRWRLFDYMEHQNQDAFNESLDKMIQYLSIRIDKSRFRVTCKNRFTENDNIVFDAELYNDSYELVNQPEVKMDVFNNEGKRFPFGFGRTSNAYRIDAGRLPVGQYRFSAQTTFGGKSFSKQGEFIVTPIIAEAMNTVADHQLLNRIAKSHDAKMFYPQNLDQLLKDILAREDIKSVSYERKKVVDIISLKWIFFVLLALFAFEWFIRKRNGAY